MHSNTKANKMYPYLYVSDVVLDHGWTGFRKHAFEYGFNVGVTDRLNNIEYNSMNAEPGMLASHTSTAATHGYSCGYMAGAGDCYTKGER